MNRKVLKIIGVVGLTGLGVLSQNNCTFAYTTDSITDWSEVVVDPSVGIDMNQPIVGANDLDQVEGLPSSASFYKPVGINVKDVKLYYISVFLDCSAITDPTNKAKCESGNLLTSSGDTLASVSSAKTFSTMQNEWGFRYNIGDSTQDPSDKYFMSLPTNRDSGFLQLNGEEQIKVDHPIIGDNKTLTLGFGAKVNGDTAAGTYNGKVIVAVVAMPNELITISDIEYMQQMTSEICKSTPEGEYTLKDTRDERVYKVAKMKDNNCWMIQNLALDSGTTEATRREINSTSSDLADGTTYMLPASNTNGWTNNAAEYMYNGTHVDNKYDNSSANIQGGSDGTGDNAGAYYSWRTAVANNNGRTIGNTDGDTVEISICPKGWTLPGSGKNEESDIGRFAELYRVYDNNKVKFDAVWHPGYAGNYDGNVLYNFGKLGHWWSRDAYSGDSAYLLHEDTNSGVTPLFNYFRRNGFSVRCVVR